MPQASASALLLHSSSGRYGADRQLHLIATALAQIGHEPLVVLPTDGPLVDDLRAAEIPVVIRPLAVIRRELLSPRGLAAIAAAAVRDAAGLRRLVEPRRLRLIHSNTSVVVSGAAAAAACRVPHLWHVREIYGRFAKAWPAYRSLLERAAALPCVSRATAAQFRPTGRVRVLYDGLWGDPGRAPRVGARKRLGLSTEAPVVAVLGRISDWKGQDVLVRALAEPPLRAHGALALIAGDPWSGAEHRADALRTLASQLGVAERLHMVGFRDDVDTVFGAADVVAVPSTAPDPLPGAAIEAAAAGCAVIASAHGGLPEIIRDRQTGVLVTPGDPRALADAAAALIEDPQRRDRLGAAAATDVRARFSVARLGEGIRELYEGVLARW